MFPDIPSDHPMYAYATFVTRMLYGILALMVVVLASKFVLGLYVWRHTRETRAERDASNQLRRDVSELLRVTKEYAQLGMDRRADAVTIAERVENTAARAAVVAKVSAEEVKQAVAEVPDRVIEKIAQSAPPSEPGTLRIPHLPQPGSES